MREFYHENGFIYPDRAKSHPLATTYGQQAVVEFEITPQSDFEGIIRTEIPDSVPMNQFITPEDFENIKLQRWSEGNPLRISYRLDTSFENIEEVEHVNGGLEKEDVHEELGEGFLSGKPPEVARRIDGAFSYSNDFETLDRSSFLRDREGVCDHFSELMSMGDETWIKNNGYARQGDSNLSSDVLDFGKHAWVVDTEREVVYDPTVVASSNVPPWEVELPSDAYFVQLPLPKISVDGDVIPEKRLNPKGESERNYWIEASVNKI